MDLTDAERTVLDLERQWWQYPGAKDQAIRTELDLSPTAFYQRLNVLIDTERALAADPILVKRLRGLRADRQRSRSLRR